MTNKQTLVVVIVNYFSANQTQSLVSQLFEYDVQRAVHIICVDNSCCDIEWQALQRLTSKHVSVLRSERNLGYGAAINKAVNNINFSEVLILNPDVRLARKTVTALLTACEGKPLQGIWGGVTVNEYGEPDYRNAWRTPSVLRTLAWAIGVHNVCGLSEQYFPRAVCETYSVDAVSGCCMLVTKSAWDQLKGFDEQFFLYSEEIDLCYRARQLGFQPTVVSAAQLYHPMHNTEVAGSRLKLLFTGKHTFIKKHFSPMRAYVFSLLFLLGALVRAAVKWRKPSCAAWVSLARAISTHQLRYEQQNVSP